MQELADIDQSFFNAQREAGDKNLFVRFYSDVVQNQEKSEKEGRPIFDDCEMVEIRVRGDRNNIVVKIVTDAERRRFRAAYAAFKDTEQKAASGTPLSQWPAVTRSLVEELKYLGFFTVEDVANATEIAFGKVMGLRDLQKRAQHFLDMSKGLAPVETLQAQVSKLQETIDAQAAMIKRQEEALAELSTAKKVK